MEKRRGDYVIGYYDVEKVTGLSIETDEWVTGFYAEYIDLSDKKHCVIMVPTDEHGTFKQYEVERRNVYVAV